MVYSIQCHNQGLDWGSSIDSVVEARGFKPDSLQWTFVSKAVWVKGILCSTPWHTAASMVRFLCFVLFTFEGGKVARAEDRCGETGRWIRKGTWCEIYKESIKK